MHGAHARRSAKRPTTDGSFVTLQDQRGLIEAVLTVANLPGAPASPDPIYRAFDPFAAGGAVMRLAESGAEAGAILWRDFAGNPSARLELWRRGVLAVLDDIRRSPDGARRRHREAVHAAMRACRCRLIVERPGFEHGRLTGRLCIEASGCQGIEVAALALLLDPTARIGGKWTYGAALRRCPYPACRRLFFRFSTNGRPRNHDTPDCKRLDYKLKRAQREGWST